MRDDQGQREGNGAQSIGKELTSHGVIRTPQRILIDEKEVSCPSRSNLGRYRQSPEPQMAALCLIVWGSTEVTSDHIAI